MTAAEAPTLETIVRLLEQSIEEQHETRDRLDAHVEIATMQFEGFEKLFDGMRSTANAQFLTLAGQLADTQKHIVRIEDHVGFLTTKVVEHDQRFDRIDARLDGIDQRLDRVDQRLDGIDTRLDAMDTRLDAIDQRFDAMDQRLDGIDQRLDRVDQRFDGIDTRLDAMDQRLDGIDTRLDGLTVMVEQIRDAVLPGPTG